MAKERLPLSGVSELDISVSAVRIRETSPVSVEVARG